MFGMGFFEILMVVVVAIIFLGPEKLPKALVDIAKFLKAVKRTIDDAKESLDKEVNLSKIKEEAIAYKASLEKGAQSITKDINLKEISPFDEPLNEEIGTKAKSDEAQKESIESNKAQESPKEPKKEALTFKENAKNKENKQDGVKNV